MTTKIPTAALAYHLIALGKTGSGKSSKLRVLVEGLLEAQQPVCIIDPKGDWWGLKSSADGKHEGYPLVIFGGEHADVPINAHSGAHVAELVATGNRPCIIDLGGWMVGERSRFFIEFASTLFRLSRGARHLVIDEVHNFAPQGKVHDPDAGKMLHWANRLASEGRGKGITILAASQRPQKCHKDFVTSCETLIACKVIHKLDRDAIKDWIDGCADPTKGREVIGDLAQLKKPEAWVWCPEIDFGPERISFPLFKTYDSFKPQPADGGKLKGWASVDLEDVKAKLATVVEEAKANDPKELRAKLAKAEQEVRALRANPAMTVDPGAEQRGYERGWREGYDDGSSEAHESLTAPLVAVMAASEAISREHAALKAAVLEVYRVRNTPLTGARAENPTRRVQPAPSQVARKGAESGSTLAGARARQIDARAPSLNGHSLELSGAERKVLAVLATYGACDSGRLALLSGYSYSGGFRNILSSLRTKGLIEGENTGTMEITGAGNQCGPFEDLPTGEDLRRHWMNFSQFGGAEKDVLAALLENPRGFTGHDLAKHVDREYSGGFRNTLSKLRTAGVLVGKNTGVMTASAELLA